MISDEDLQTLIDEREIRRCVMRYCHGTDRLDWKMIVDCYVPGAWDEHGSYNGPIEKLVEWLADNSRRRGAKQHFVANQLIEIDGDTAVCESYFFCYIEFVDDPDFGGSDTPTAVVLGGRYVDRLTRAGASWLIAGRTVLLDWSRRLGRVESWSAPAAAHFVHGRRDGQDAAQLAFADIARQRRERANGVRR